MSFINPIRLISFASRVELISSLEQCQSITRWFLNLFLSLTQFPPGDGSDSTPKSNTYENRKKRKRAFGFIDLVHVGKWKWCTGPQHCHVAIRLLPQNFDFSCFVISMFFFFFFSNFSLLRRIANWILSCFFFLSVSIFVIALFCFGVCWSERKSFALWPVHIFPFSDSLETFWGVSGDSLATVWLKWRALGYWNCVCCGGKSWRILIHSIDWRSWENISIGRLFR